MKTEFNQKIKILASMIDMHSDCGLISNLNLVQDNMCEYFKSINSDGLSLVESSNAFFVLTKTKLKIIKNIKWCDLLNISSDTIKKSSVRVNVLTKATKDNELVFESLQELCAIDSNTRKLRLVETTAFPKNIDCGNNDSNIEFDKLNFILDEKCYKETVEIKLTNLDVYKHLNNVEYVKLMMNTLSLDFYMKIFIKEIEINYISECKLNDIIKIYSLIKDDKIYFQIVKDDLIITKALLKYELLDEVYDKF